MKFVFLAGLLSLVVADVAAAADGPRVPIRAAAHARGRVRFVFDWPVASGAKLEENETAPRLVFNTAPQFDLARVPRSLVPLIRVEGDTATFALRPGGTIRQSRNGNGVIIDIIRAAPVPPPVGVTESLPVESPPAETPMPIAQESPPPTPTGQTSIAQRAPEQKPPEQKPPEQQKPEPKPVELPARPASPAAIQPMPSPAAPPLPARPGAFGPELPTTVRRDPAAVALHFDWPAEVRIAAFVRDGRTWIVFDRPATVPLERILQGAGELLTGGRQLPAAGATVLRLDALPGFSPRVARDATGWTVELLPGRQRPGRSLMPQVEPGARPAGPTVSIAMDSPGTPIALRDPDIGDRLLIVPALTGDLGLDDAYRVPEFRLLPSSAGLVLVPEADPLPVGVAAGKVRIGGDAGLLLSGGPMDAPRDEPVRAERVSTSLFDFAGWGMDDQPFNEARQALTATITALPANQRSNARLDLAQFLFARGFNDESAGVIDLVIADDPDRADSPSLRALRGAALLLAGDLEGAQPDLFRPGLDGVAEIGLWRGAWHGMREEWRPALSQFGRGWAYLDSYPKPLQVKLALLGAEAALSMGNGKLAGERLNQIERLKMPEPTAARVAVLRGRLLAAQGNTAEAIALWRTVEAGPDRMAQARAGLSRLEIQLRDNLIERPAAIEELERLRFVWRGDAIELGILELLGRCYLDVKDYWNGLSTLRYALSVFGDTPQAAPVAEKMADAFRRLFVAGEARSMPPLKAMALFEEYRELAPLGPDGDVVLRELAGRLLALDLLGPAADLIDHQMRYRLEKAARADAGAALAVIRLLDKKPEQALDALDASEGEAPADLGTRRRQLRARALLDSGRAKEALAALGQDRTRESEALRADLNWRAGNWLEAARTLARIAPNEKSLDPAGADNVLKWAVALSLAGKRDELGPLWSRYGPAMATTPSGAAFRMIAGDQAPDPGALATVARSLAQSDGFSASLARWRRAIERGDSIAKDDGA